MAQLKVLDFTVKMVICHNYVKVYQRVNYGDKRMFHGDVIPGILWEADEKALGTWTAQ